MVDRRILLRNSMEQFRCIKNAPINNPDQVTHKSVAKENQKAWLENARKSLKEALVSAEKYRLEKGLKNNPTSSSAHHSTAKENVLAVPRPRFLPTSKDRVPALASVAGNLPVSTSAKAPNQDATIPELDMAGFPSRMTENSAATDATTKSNGNNSQASSCAKATTSLARKQQQAGPSKVTKSSTKHSLKRRLKQVNILERVAVKTLSFTRRRRSSATTEVRNRSVCSSVHTDTTQRSQVESEDQTGRVTRSMSAKIAIPRAPVKASYRAKVGDKAKPCDGVREDRTIVFVANANNVGPFSSNSAQANFSGVSIVIQPVVTVAPPAIVGNTIIAGAEQGLQCFGLCRYESATGRLGVAESAVTKLPLQSISGLSSCFQNMSLSSGLITLGAGVTAAPPAPSAGKSDTALQDLQPAECNSASQGMDVPADSVSGKSEDDSGESFTVQTLEQLVKSLGINEYVQSPAVTPSAYALASGDSLVGGTEGLLAQDSSAAQRHEDCAEPVESGASVGCGVIKLAQDPDAAALCASVYPNQAPETNPEPHPSSGHQPRTNAKDRPAENGTVNDPLVSDFIQEEACSKNVELSDEDDDDCVIVGVSYPNIAEFYDTSYQVAQTVHTVTQTSDAVTPMAESSSHLSAKPGQLFLDCQPNCDEKDLSEAGFVQEEGSLKTSESTMTLSKDYTTAAVGDKSSVAGAAVSTIDTSSDYNTAVGERDAVSASASPASETAQDLHLAWQGQPGSISEIESTALSSSVPCEAVTRRKDGVAESSDNVDLSPSISTTTEPNAVTSGARNSSIPVSDMEEDVESHEQCAPATIAKGSALENATAMHLSKDDYVQELGCPKTVQPLNVDEKDSASDAESVETDVVAERSNIGSVEHDCSTALPEPNEAKSHAEDEQGLVVEAEQGLELYRDCPPEANANNNAPEDCSLTELSKGGCVEELGNSNDVEPFSSADNGNVTFAGVDRNAAEPLDTVVEGNRGFSSAMHGSDQCHIMSYNDQITTTALELPLYGHCLPEPVTRIDFTEDVAAEESSESDSTKVFSTLKPLDPFNTEAHITQYFQNVVGVDLGHNTVTEAPKVVASCDEYDSSTDTMTGCRLQVQTQCQAETVTRTNSLEDIMTEQFSEDDCDEEPGTLETEPLNSAREVTTSESTASFPEDTVARHFGYSAVTEAPKFVALCDEYDSSTDTMTGCRLQVQTQCQAGTVTRIDSLEDIMTEQFSEDDCDEEPGTLETEPLNSAREVTTSESTASFPEDTVARHFGYSAVTEAPKVVALCDEYDSSTDTMTGCRLQVQTQCQAGTVTRIDSLEDIMTEQFSEDDCDEEPGTLETEPLNSAREVTTSESTASFPEDMVARHFDYCAVTEVPKVVALCDKHDSSTDTIRLQVHTQCQAETVARTNSFEDTITEQLSEDQCVEEPGTLETEPLNREDVTIAESVAVVVRSNSPEDTYTKQLSEGDCIEEPETPDTDPLNSADDASIAESIDSDTVELDVVNADLRGSAVFLEPSIPALSATGVNDLLLETAQELYPLWQGPLETTTKYTSSGDSVMQEPSDHDCIQKVCSVENVEPLDSVNKDDLTALEKECVYDRSFCQKVDSSKNDELTPAEEERGNTKWACPDQSVGTITQGPRNETGVAEDGSNLIERTNEELKVCSQCPLETSPASNLSEDSVATEFLESDCIQEKTVDPLIIASRDSVAIPDANKNGASEPFSNAFDVNCGSNTVIPDLVIASTGNDSCVPTETGQQSQSHKPCPAKTRAESRLCENTAAKRLLESNHIWELNHLETVGVLNCPTEDPRTVAEGQEEDLAESSKNAVEVHEDFSTVTRELEVEMSLASAFEGLTSDTTPELILQSPSGTITRSNSPEDVMEEPPCGDRSLEAIALNEAKDMSREHDHAVEDAVSDSVTKEPSQDDHSHEVGAFVEVGDSSCGNYTVAEDVVSKASNDGINARQFCSVAQQPDMATLPAKNSRSSSQTSEMGEDAPIQGHCHPDVNKQDLETTGPLNSGKEEDRAVMEDHQKAVDVDDLTSPMLDSETETSLVTGVCSLASEIAPESCFGCPARTIARRNFPEEDITEEPSQSECGEEVGCVKKVKSSSSEDYTVVKDAVSELSNGTVDIANSISVVREPGTATLPSRQTETEKSLFWLMPFRSSKSGSPTVEAGQEPVFCGQQTNARGDHNEATVTAEPSKQEVVRKFCFTNVKCVVIASSLGCDNSTIVGDDGGSAETPSKDVEVDCSVGNNVRELGLTSHFKDGDNLISESLPDSELCRPREPETVIGSKSDENTFVKQLSDGDCVKEPCSFKALEPLSINEKCVTVTESDQSEPSMSFNNSDGISINETSTTATELDQKEASNSFNYSAGITCAWNSVALDLNTQPSCDNRSPITRAGQELKSCQECPEAIKESVLSQDPGMSEESKSEASESFKDSAGVTCGLNSTVLDVDATASGDNCSPVARTGQELQSCQGCPEAIKESVLSQDPGMSEESKSEASESFDDSADVTCDLNSTVLDVDATASGDSCSPVARTGQGLQLFQECPKAIKESVHSQDPGMSEESKSEASESFKDSAGVTCDFNSTVLDADATASGDNCSPVARTGKELQSCQECPEAAMEGVVSQGAGMSEESKSEASQSFKDSAGTTCDLNSTVLDVDATASSGNRSPITRTGQELQPCQEYPEAITESVFSQDAGMSEESKSEATRSFKDSAGITCGLNSTVLDVDATAAGDNCSPITRTGQELQSCQECPDPITESVLSEDAAVSEQSKRYLIQEPVRFENVRSSSSMDENGSLVTDNVDGQVISSIDGTGVDQSICLPEPDAASHALGRSRAISEASQGLQSQTPCQREKNTTGNGPLEDFSPEELSRSESVEEVLSCQPETNRPRKDVFTEEISRSDSVEEVWNDWPETVKENRSFEGALTRGLSRIGSAGQFVGSDNVKPAEHFRIAGKDCVAMARRERKPCGTLSNSSDVNCGVDGAIVRHPNSGTSRPRPDQKMKKRRDDRKHRHRKFTAWRSDPPADAATKCPPQKDYTEGVRVCFDYSNNLHVTVAPQVKAKFAQLSDSVAEANCVANPRTEESDATSLCAGSSSGAVSGAEHDSQRHRPIRIAKRRSPKAAATKDLSNHGCAAGPSGHSKTAAPLEVFSGAVYEPHMGRHVIEKEIVPDSQDFGVSAVRYRISWLPAQFL